MAGGIHWAHSDSQDLSGWAKRGVELATSGAAWPDGAEGNRLLRAWLCSYLATIANLGPTPVTQLLELQAVPGLPPDLAGPGARYLVEPKQSANAANLEIQTLLAVAFAALVGRRYATQARFTSEWTPASAMNVRTVDGGSAELVAAVVPTTSFLPILGWIVVSVLGAAAAGVAYLVASQVNETRALEITQQGKTTQAIAAMTTASTMVELHQQRERERGASLPYDAQEQALLGTLRKTITDVAGWQPPDMKTLPNVKAASERIGTGLGLGTLAILGVGAYVLLRESKGARGFRLGV